MPDLNKNQAHGLGVLNIGIQNGATNDERAAKILNSSNTGHFLLFFIVANARCTYKYAQQHKKFDINMIKGNSFAGNYK